MFEQWSASLWLSFLFCKHRCINQLLTDLLVARFKEPIQRYGKSWVCGNFAYAVPLQYSNIRLSERWGTQRLIVNIIISSWGIAGSLDVKAAGYNDNSTNTRFAGNDCRRPVSAVHGKSLAMKRDLFPFFLLGTASLAQSPMVSASQSRTRLTFRICWSLPVAMRRFWVE